MVAFPFLLKCLPSFQQLPASPQHGGSYQQEVSDLENKAILVSFDKSKFKEVL